MEIYGNRLVENEVPQRKDADVQTSPPREVLQNNVEKPLYVYPLDEYLPKEMSPEQSLNISSPDPTDFVGDTLQVMNTARRQIQNLQRETINLRNRVNLRIPKKQPSSDDKVMWNEKGHKPKNTVPKDFTSFAELEKEIVRINPGPRLTDVEQLESSGSKERTNCPPNSPEVNFQYVDRVVVQNVSRQEIVNYDFKEDSRTTNENADSKNLQSQAIVAKGRQKKLRIKDITHSPKRFTQNVCECNQSQEEITQDQRQTIEKNVDQNKIREIDNKFENSSKSQSTVSKTKSDAETNTETGVRFRNTPNTAIISVKTQETSTRLSDKVENKECCLRKTLQIQAMPSIKIQPKFTIQKGPKVHIPPSSTLAAALMKRKNVELKEICHPSVNYVYMERDGVQFDRHNVNEEEVIKTDRSKIDDSQNIPNSLKDNTKKDISVHDKLNNLAKTLSSKLDKEDKKKTKNNEKLSHTLKTLSGNISKLFDNYLETVPQNLKRLSPRMNMIASLLLEELQSPHSLTDDYCCKLIDSMHYLIQDLEKEYETRVCQKNLLQPPQHCAINATKDGINQTELRRPQQKPVVHSENSQQQTSNKQRINSVQSSIKTHVKENYPKPSSVLLDSHKKSETFVRKSVQKKPVISLRQRETSSNVKNILQKSENPDRTSRTGFSNRNPLLQSNYLKPIESGLNFTNTGAIPKTNRHVTQNSNKPEGNFELKQWQNERMKNIQEIHKKLLMTELTLTRSEKYNKEENKAREIEIDIPSDSSSAMEFVKKYIQTSDHIPEDSFIGHTTPIADCYDGGNKAEKTSAQMNKDIEETISRQEIEKVSEIEDETSGSEAVEADDADNDMEVEYAEDWEVDEDDANSSQTSAEEVQIEESHLPNIVEEEDEVSSMDDKAIKPLANDINNIKECQHDLVGSTEILPEVQITSVHNPKQREMNTEEINSSNISVKSNNLMAVVHLENVSKVNNVSKGCNTSVKKSFCDGIDQIPLKLSWFGFENNKQLVKNYPEKSNSEIRLMKLNTEQISDLSVPNLNLDTSPIENLIEVSVPKTNRQENIVEVNSSRNNQSINVVVHVGNDSDLSKTYDKKEPATKINQENTSSSDKVIKNVLANNSSTSTNLETVKNVDENVNIDELISSNLKKYVIQPTVNEMFEKFNQFKTNTTIDNESLQNKQESQEEAKNIGHGMNSKRSETVLNLIKPNVILQSSNEFWHSIQDFPTNQDKVTQSEKTTQDFSVQTDHEKITIQTQVTESLASDSNQKKSHDDMTDCVNFSKKSNDVSKKYVSSSLTKSSDSDTRPSSSSSSSSAVPYRLRSLKWSLSSLFNSDEPLSEGEIIVSTSSSGAHSFGEVRSTPKTKHYDTLSLGEIKTKPQRKPCKRSTGTSTPELTYSVSKERLKSIPKYINPQPKKENNVQVEEKTISNRCVDNKTEQPGTSNVDSVLLQPTNYTDSSLERKPQNKIIKKTFNALATDILQELINERSVMDDQVTSNEIIANIVKLNKNANMKNKEIKNEINLVCSENVMTDKNVESVQHRIESPNEIIVVTNEEVKKQVRIDKSHKSKLDLLKTLSNSKSTFDKQKEHVEATSSQLVQTFSTVNKKKNVTRNDRLVMKLENERPNLEVFIEESHSEHSSVSIFGTSISSVSSDNLPGVCEFDLTLGSHSDSEKPGSKHGNLLCTSSSGS